MIKKLWKSKTIYRKIMMIMLGLHFVFCFILPLAKMRTSTEYVNDVLSFFSLAELPRSLTIASLIRFYHEYGSSDIFIPIFIILCNIGMIALHLRSNKRKSYVGNLAAWFIVFVFETLLADVIDDLGRYGYRVNSFGYLLYMISFAICVMSVIGFLMEARAKRLGQYDFDFKVDPDKVESLKNGLGSAAATASALAKIAAEKASEELPKVQEKIKDFIESAKEDDEDSEDEPFVPKKKYPSSGSVIGVKGMFAGAKIVVEPGDEIRIGRAADSCHLVIEGNAISRKHCTIEYDKTSGNYYVTDYSENGTFLSTGARLPKEKKMLLSPGTMLRIGNEENTFRLG